MTYPSITVIDSDGAFCDFIDQIKDYCVGIVFEQGAEPVNHIVIGTDIDERDGFVTLLVQDLDEETFTGVGEIKSIRTDTFIDIVVY